MIVAQLVLTALESRVQILAGTASFLTGRALAAVPAVQPTVRPRPNGRRNQVNIEEGHPMHAYALIGPERGELVELPEPQAGVNQALVRVISNGVCASDLPTWAGQQGRYPIYLGHEPV